jgi:mRNA interferase MazF
MPLEPRPTSMKRGELYLVANPSGDPKRQRVFVVVSHQGLIDSNFSTVICAPVFSRGANLETKISVGHEEGMKHDSWIMCDNLTSIDKNVLTNYIGSLSRIKLRELNRSLAFALDLRIGTQ